MAHTATGPSTIAGIAYTGIFTSGTVFGIALPLGDIFMLSSRTVDICVVEVALLNGRMGVDCALLPILSSSTAVGCCVLLTLSSSTAVGCCVGEKVGSTELEHSPMQSNVSVK